MKNLICVAIFCAALFAGAAAPGLTLNHAAAIQSPQAASVPTRAASDVRLEAFDIVWRTVKEKHFDPTFGGVDWDKVRERYAPRAAGVKSDQELYTLLQQMLGELKQSHFNIIPPEAVPEEGLAPAAGQIGVELDIIDDLAVITRVEQGSAAARVGLRPGFVIKQVDNSQAASLIDRLRKGNRSPAIVRLYASMTIAARIAGAPGSSVRLTYLDERDQTRSVTIVRERLKGEMSPAIGNFPPQYMEFETKRLPGQIGYIRFNIFAVPLMPKIKEAIRSLGDAAGIIIDLRGNPGGLGAMSSGIAGMLETRQTSLGTMRMRTGHQNMAVFPQANPFTGPVAIIINGGSASTSEILAAGMQELGRAVIVGERSAGAALPSYFQKLPTGARLQYAIADFRTPKGTLLEGRGVVPDFEVKLARRELLEGRDAQLERAIERINKMR